MLEKSHFMIQTLKEDSIICAVQTLNVFKYNKYLPLQERITCL